MSKFVTVSDMVTQCRSLLDEANRDVINDIEDILPALNRAQDTAANILAKHYESPMLTYKIVQPEAGKTEYPIPTDALEERIEKVEAFTSGQYISLQRVNYREISSYEISYSTVVPYYYAVIGDNFKVLPGPTNYPLRVWYLKEPLPLVKSQGRITKVGAIGDFILVDSVGSDLTTESDNLNSYINIISPKTGEVKASFQIKTINDTKITIKSIPSRTDVEGSPISTSFLNLTDPRTGNPVSILPDDLISVVSGTCVPFFRKPVTNFIIQYAVTELKRKLGEDSQMDEKLRAELEAQVKSSWVGREQSNRVKRANKIWG